jgi:tRNA threonylcarbamoyladenosine biosynthesis protein TsaB
MLTLGIETAGLTGSVALLRDEQLLSQRDLGRSGRRHARSLVWEVQALFEEAGARPTDCTLVAVGQGPGSFTGLRLGIVCAKTWAYATRCQLVAVPTLHAWALAAPADETEVDVLADAERGELFVGRFRRSPSGTWRATQPAAIVPRACWLAELTSERAVMGPAVVGLREALAGRCRIIPSTNEVALAVRVAELGLQLWHEGHDSDPWSLEPVYLRRSAAEEKAGPVSP